MATILLLVAAGLQLALPTISALPEETTLAPRRMREPAPPSVPSYPGILSDPIFAPDRKADASIEPPAGGMGDYAVLGIATAGAGNATALIKSPDGTISRIQPGAVLDGWKLIQADMNSLTFEKNGERHILTVEKRPTPPPAASNGVTAPENGSAQ